MKWIVLTLLIGSVARANCVDRLKYPTTLTVPGIEAWASDRIFLGGSVETECQMAEELIERFKLLGSVVAKSNGGHPVRGTHSKGVCLAGQFTADIDKNLSADKIDILKSAPVFADSANRKALVRFANGASKIDADYKPDVRALSFKVDLGSGRAQDFSFNNVPRFQIPDLDSFVRVMDMSTGAILGKIQMEDGEPNTLDLISYLNSLYGPVYAGNYLRKLNTVKKLKKEDTGYHMSYATQAYWSTTPFLIGSARSEHPYSQIARFGASPCGGSVGAFKTQAEAVKFAQSQVEAGHAQKVENYLIDSIVTDVRKEPLCFDVFAEFLDDEPSFVKQGPTRATELVEDASTIWNSRSYNVGRLQITTVESPEVCEKPENGINVVRNQESIVALGQTNRARSFVEKASRDGRTQSK